MKQLRPLDYRSELGRPGSVLVPLVLLVVVGGLIWALHELQIMPYRPPYDMSTLLGGPEEAFVTCLIAILAIIWVGVLVWGFVRFRRRPPAS